MNNYSQTELFYLDESSCFTLGSICLVYSSLCFFWIQAELSFHVHYVMGLKDVLQKSWLQMNIPNQEKYYGILEWTNNFRQICSPI